MAFNVVSKIDDRIKIQNVLISTSNKEGLDSFVSELVSINPGVKIYSTGGTYSYIEKVLGEKSKTNLVSVSSYTKQPEMQGGLVKTLDYKIYLGLLSETYNDFHQSDIKRLEAISFDMVVVNLYPFKETIKNQSTTLENARANIDIGGPTMCRASAKNFIRVASVCNPSDYPSIINELKSNNCMLSYKTRFNLAKKSFAHTADYDRAISDYLNNISDDEAACVYSFAK